MEYSNEIIINAPRKKIVDALVDHELMKKWAPTLKSIVNLNGEPLTKGAKSKLIFETDDKPMIMVETILEIDLPNLYNCLYESDGVKNWSNNLFSELLPNQTKWEALNKFEFAFDISDREKKLINDFSAQTMCEMEDFKKYIESLE